MSLICPACRKIQLRSHRDPGTGLEIDTCPKCWGMWFDANELGSFFKSSVLRHRFFLPEETHPLESVGYTMSTRARVCPRCNKAMKERLYGDVSIDICSACSGIWLDDGELQRIVAQYHKGAKNESTVAGELQKGLGPDVHQQSNIGTVLQSFLSFFKKHE
ncbi:MAG: zf-TFIIB domain-containing protein [Firmicutes bacterium]|nr:zf-TFIIB domain-containing protein [Bacillota bacterium]